MLALSDTHNINNFLDHIKRFNKAPMFIYKDRSYTYSEIHTYSFIVADWLSVNEVKTLMFSISNSPFSISLFLASWQQKIQCVPVNPRFIANELLGLLKRYTTTMLIIEPHQSSQELIYHCQKHHIRLVISNDCIALLAKLKSVNYNGAHLSSSKNDEGITYHISSGTGGYYNFHGHYTNQILKYAHTRQLDYGLIKGDISLVHLSFNHAYAFSYQLLPNIALGNCMILAPNFEAKISLELIQKYGVTALALLPTMYYQLAHEAQKITLKHQLRHLSVAGDQSSQSLMNLIKNTFSTPLLNGFGMTEVFGYAQNLIESKVYNKIKIFDDIQLRVKNIQNEEINNISIKQQHIGELYIKTPMRPISSKGEWLATGDYGYIDNKHNLYFLGRIKDLIIKGGSKIAPMELEYYLYKLSFIRQVSVLGKKNSIWGEIVCACITPQDNSVIVSLNDVNEFLRPFLASYKHIDRIFLYSELPLNVTGKIDRLRLKKEIENA